MNCPRCKEGFLTKTKFKDTFEDILSCDACNTFWFNDEDINQFNGHLMGSFADRDDYEYSLSNVQDKDIENRSSDYSKYD